MQNNECTWLCKCMDVLQNWRQTISGEHSVNQEKSLKFWLTLEIFGNTNKIKKTLYKERDFRKIYLSITLEKFDRRVTGQSGCELKIAKTRFGRRNNKNISFFLFSQNWLKVYTLYTLRRLFEEISKKIRLSPFRDTQKSAKSPNFEWSCT